MLSWFSERSETLAAMSLLIRRYVHSLEAPTQCANNLQWSGADYADNLLKTVTGGVSSTAAMGKGVTESQFGSKL